MPAIRVGLVGVGKIALDQHIPALRGNSGFDLVATADPASTVESLPHYSDVVSLLKSERVDAIAICTPPQVRFIIAKLALQAGKHVLLEKPPCANVAQVIELTALASGTGASVYTAWHSQHAAGVHSARSWLRERPRIDTISVNWREDVREWHPGQDWIWKEGGLGVFDPGINALSIISAICAHPLRLTAANLWIPSNCATPISADLTGTLGESGRFRASFDFLHASNPTWSIHFRAAGEHLVLSEGGAKIAIGEIAQVTTPTSEYASMYRQFLQLIKSRRSKVDSRPLAIVEEAFRLGKRISTDEFIE